MGPQRPKPPFQTPSCDAGGLAPQAAPETWVVVEGQLGAEPVPGTVSPPSSPWVHARFCGGGLKRGSDPAGWEGLATVEL